MTWTVACLSAVPFALLGAAGVLLGLAIVAFAILMGRSFNKDKSR